MGPHQMKEELKCVSMESGEVCVTVIGIDERLKLCVVNWDIIHHVRELSRYTVKCMNKLYMYMN